MPPGQPSYNFPSKAGILRVSPLEHVTLRWSSTEHPRGQRLPSTFRRKVIKNNVGLKVSELQNNGIVAEHNMRPTCLKFCIQIT